jgi:hypothetical protein
MADAVEESLKEQKARLLNDLLRHDQSFYYQNVSNEIKECIFKEGFLKKLIDFILALNEEFEDVHFEYSWPDKLCRLNSEMQKVCDQIYDDEYTEDDDDYYSLYEEKRNKDYHFMCTPIQEVDIQLTYYWERKCNLGCKHRTKRFYVMNLPKMLDILTFWDLRPPIRTLVKEYIPDFFYDPTVAPKKRGRPKSSRS